MGVLEVRELIGDGAMCPTRVLHVFFHFFTWQGSVVKCGKVWKCSVDVAWKNNLTVWHDSVAS